jgi:AcrR family transcriptional regulator
VSANAEQLEGRPRAPGRPRAGRAVDDDAFLEAALHAFAVRGYDGVSVRTLSKELGVSHSWVNQRYGSKEGLWYKAVDHGFGRQAATLTFDPTISDPLEQLEHAIRQFLHYSAEHRDLGLLMNSEGARDSERLDYIYDNYIEPVLAPLERLLGHLIDERRVHPVSMRSLFLLFAHGGTAPFGLVALARRLNDSDPVTARNVTEHIDAVTHIIINGLRSAD